MEMEVNDWIDNQPDTASRLLKVSFEASEPEI